MSKEKNELSEIYRTYAEIDLEKIKHNGDVAQRIFRDSKILCVLKADAYGHGIRGILPATETFADLYAVATVEEGLEVRAGSRKPVLLFGPVPTEKMLLAVRAGLIFTLGSREYASRLNKIVEEAGIAAECHLKIDTGLNRSGIKWREGEDFISEIAELYSHKNLNITGTYTHFACGDGCTDWELEFTELQFSRFKKACNVIRQAGYDMGSLHCTSTGGSLVHPEYRLDIVRLGMMPLGMSYSDESVTELGLVPALRWVSFVAAVKDLDMGESVSYGCTFRAEKKMKVALVTCGYADGYRRSYSNKTFVLIGGRRVPVVGRVAMDYLMIDVSNIEDVSIGDEVVLLGEDMGDMISAQEISERCDSVSGEVTCAISARVPRIYKQMK